MSDQPILEARGIVKRFPGVLALDGVDLTVRAGEVHGLAGENGSGKSTLVKILAGRYRPDAGTLLIDGRERRLGSAAEGLGAGVGLVAQEVLVQRRLTVTENILLGRMPRRFGVLDWRAARRETTRLLDELGVSIDPAAEVGTLPLHQQQMVGIVKTAARRPRVLILDEPTSALAEDEVTALFSLVRRLRTAGVGVVYITHRLREYLELVDRMTVLRDGRFIGERPRDGLEEEEIVRMMVGRDLDLTQRRPPFDAPADAPVPALEIRGLRSRKLHDVSLTVRAGEVVGIAGQSGAGRTSLLRTLFGLHSHTGEVLVGGRRVRLRNAHDAIRAGIGYVPEDRKRTGLVLQMSVADNLTITQWKRLSFFGVSRRRAEGVVVRDAVEAMRIKAARPQVPVGTLSGGNQQKVVLGKWLALEPTVLLLDEPTRGVDIGAKGEIYELIEELTAQGLGVLLCSSELPELLRICDRILVMSRGRVVGEVGRDEATEESITAMAFEGMATEDGDREEAA